MAGKKDRPGPAGHTFPSTRWSLVGRAGHPDPAVRRAALAELLARYLPVLEGYLVRVRRIAPERAGDLLQEFLVSKVFEKQLVARARRERGRFRSYLLKALDHHAANACRAERRRARHQAAKGRGAGAGGGADPRPGPAEAFDAAWARQILAEALVRMEGECRRTGRGDVWGVFEERVLAEVRGDRAPLPYERLVARYGLKSPGQASNLVITGKRMLERMLRGVIAEYEPEERGIDEELADLRAILARGGTT